MSWGSLNWLRERLPLRNACTIVLAGGIGLATIWYGGVRVLHVIAPLGPSPVVVIFVAVMVVAFAVATVIVYVMERAAQPVRVIKARLAAKHQEKRDAALQRAAAARQETRLRALLPAFPEEHRTVLARFVSDGIEHIVLPRAGEIGAYSITKALSESGFLVQLAPVDGARAIYALNQIAVGPVRDYFEAVHAVEAANRREQVEAAVLGADESARQLLGLFGNRNPDDPTEPPHPWLTHDVYATIHPLIQHGVLVLVPTARTRGPNTPLIQPIALTDDGRQAVERHILGHPAARTRVDVRLDRVAGTGSSGDGALGSHPR